MDSPSAGSLQAPDGIGKHVMLLPELISHNGHWRARHPAIVSAEGTLTWEDFAARVERIATGLSAAGLAGERIGIVMDNEPAAIEIICGAMRAGAVAVPLNISVADPTIETLLMDADIRGLFVSPAHRARIGERARAMAPLLVSTGEPVPAGSRLPTGAIASRRVSTSPSLPGKRFAISSIRRERPAHQRELSIRTRRARTGFMISRTRLLSFGRTHIAHDRPLFEYHMGQHATDADARGTLVLHAGFDAAAVLETFQRERISHVSMVPIQLQRLLAEPRFQRRGPLIAAKRHVLRIAAGGRPQGRSSLPSPLGLLRALWFDRRHHHNAPRRKRPRRTWRRSAGRFPAKAWR